MAVQMVSPKKFTLYFTAVLLLSAIFLSTCSEESEYGEASDYEKLGADCVNSKGDSSAPTISELSPADNSTNTPVASKIVVTFSDAMLAYSITTNTADTKCTGSLQLSSDDFSTCIKMSGSPVASDNDTTFTVTPASSLSLQTNYKFKITTSVVENSCNKLATDNTTTNGFTTAGPGSGTIKGKVISDVDNNGLSGVNVQFYGTTIDNTTTDSNGEFNTEVDVGDYSISYSKDGYIDESQDVPLETDGQTLEVSTLRMLSTSCASTGNISGNISDAVSGDNVTGVYLEARKGINRPWRPVKATDTTDSSGDYSFNSMNRGWYTVQTSKSGYINSKFYVRSCGDISNQDSAVSEVLPSSKSMRIVLSWQLTDPVTGNDLDSHIQIPDNQSSAWHLHWDVGGGVCCGGGHYTYSSSDSVTLDRDDQDGAPGTETITITEVRSGFNYSYSVHDYTNKGISASDNASTKLSDSGAIVTVYYNNTATKYTVPNGQGNVWRVFTFTESGGLTKVGTFTNAARQADVY